MVRFIKMFSVMVVILFLSSITQEQVSPDKKTLRGIKAMAVLVENLRQDIEKDGLKKSSIQTDVELKLRLAGIKVLTKEEGIKPASPYLYIQVSSVKYEDLMYSYSISVDFCQYVYLYRDTDIHFYATTWSIANIGFFGVNRVKEIRDGIKDQVDKFINDYLAVNPKE